MSKEGYRQKYFIVEWVKGLSRGLPGVLLLFGGKLPTHGAVSVHRHDLEPTLSTPGFHLTSFGPSYFTDSVVHPHK